MSPAISTFLLEAVNFLILASVLSWVLFKPVRTAIASRRKMDEESRAEAAARLKEAEAVHNKVLEEQKKNQVELDAQRAEAAAAAKQEAHAIRAEAIEAARHEQETLRQQLHSLEESEVERLAESAATVARKVVQKLLTDIEGPDLEQALRRAACRELKALGEGLRPVTVESAVVLGDDARAEIVSVVGGRNDVDFITRPELGAGLRIRTSRGLVDASAAGLSSYAKRELVQQLDSVNGSKSGE